MTCEHHSIVLEFMLLRGIASNRLYVFTGNCNPKFMRASLYVAPASSDMLKTSQVPLVVGITPFARLHAREVRSFIPCSIFLFLPNHIRRLLFRVYCRELSSLSVERGISFYTVVC